MRYKELTKNIYFKNYKKESKINKLKKDLDLILNKKNSILNSLSSEYKNDYNLKKIQKIKKKLDLRIIGMGGSILGTQAIYSFLKKKIKKKTYFIDNLASNNIKTKNKNFLNLVISKSGNTLETLSNANILINKNDKNIFITEKKSSYLYLLAEKLKAEIIHHNNFIGGRFSVLSEVGMLPAELMGFKSHSFRNLNSLIKNKKFINALISNVSSTLFYIKNKKFNSVILNYDQSSENLFRWYQQLVAESLGKKSKGILPIISNMPKDNHSVMQLYLDGFKKNFFTFFFIRDKFSPNIDNNKLLYLRNYLKNKSINQIVEIQKIATENVFKKKKIPYRGFVIDNKNEKTISELFIFFILETILLGRALNVNPYDQPSVELIKTETYKIFN